MKKLLALILGLTIFTTFSACSFSFDKNGGEAVSNTTKLPAPTVTGVFDDYIYWDEVPNASSYLIKINDLSPENAGNSLKYSIASIVDNRIDANTPTELHIYVKAKGNQILYGDSDWSAEYVYTYTKKNGSSEKTALATPIFSFDDENNLIEWTQIEGADGYELLVNDNSIIIPQMIQCKYRPNVEANIDFTFSMRALSPENNSNYTDSNWTRSITLKYSPSNEEVIADQEAVQKAQELGIGYGYNFVSDKYFDTTSSSVNSIIDVDKLFQTSRLNTKPSNVTESNSIYKESISEFQTSVAASLNSEVSAGATFNIFSANVTAGLQSSSSIDFSKYGKSGFLNCYSYAEYKNYQVTDFGTTSDLAKLFTVGFKSIVNKEGAYASMTNEQIAAYILNNYGTHLILGVKTGGRLDYYYSFATNNSKVASDFKNAVSLKASTDVAGIISASTNNSLSTELSVSLSNGETKNESSFVVYGGSTDEISASNIGEKFISWSSSINESNARSIGVTRNGIVYLPTIISYLNADIADALNTLINTKADEAYQSLIGTFKNAETFTDSGATEARLESLNVYDDTIRSGEYKVAGSGRSCNSSFALDKYISELKEIGYTHLKIYIDYKLREQDNCYIYVNLYDENNNSHYYRRVEHGGNSVNYTYAMYTIDLEIDLNDLPSNKFRISFKAQNKIFRDFYVGTVTGKVYAIKKTS